MVENGVETENFIKQTNLHQYPIAPLNVSHSMNCHNFSTPYWEYDINVDDVKL